MPACSLEPTEQEVKVDWDALKGVTLSVPSLQISVTAQTVKEAIFLLQNNLRSHFHEHP